MGSLKQSDAYKEALAEVQSDPAAIAGLGEPIEPGFFLSGSVTVSGPSGEAELSIPVHGPQGEGTLYLEASKRQDGDLGSMLYPEQLGTYLGYYEKAKAIWFEVTASEIDKMQRDLDGCSGKVPIDTYMAAKKFLEHFSAAKRVWDSKVAPGLNDLRTKGLACANLDQAAWRACLADAECRGVPPACGPEPSLEGAYD